MRDTAKTDQCLADDEDAALRKAILEAPPYKWAEVRGEEVAYEDAFADIVPEWFLDDPEQCSVRLCVSEGGSVEILFSRETQESLPLTLAEVEDA